MTMKRVLIAILACIMVFITLGSSAEGASANTCPTAHLKTYNEVKPGKLHVTNVGCQMASYSITAAFSGTVGWEADNSNRKHVHVRFYGGGLDDMYQWSCTRRSSYYAPDQTFACRAKGKRQMRFTIFQETWDKIQAGRSCNVPSYMSAMFVTLSGDCVLADAVWNEWDLNHACSVDVSCNFTFGEVNDDRGNQHYMGGEAKCRPLSTEQQKDGSVWGDFECKIIPGESPPVTVFWSQQIDGWN
jgi:hypothetical protein